MRVLVRHVPSDVLLSNRSDKDPAVDSPGELFVLDGLDDFRRKQVYFSTILIVLGCIYVFSVV